MVGALLLAPDCPVPGREPGPDPPLSPGGSGGLSGPAALALLVDQLFQVGTVVLEVLLVDQVFQVGTVVLEVLLVDQVSQVGTVVVGVLQGQWASRDWASVLYSGKPL